MKITTTEKYDASGNLIERTVTRESEEPDLPRRSIGYTSPGIYRSPTIGNSYTPGTMDR
jgi:hypothetical protein